MFRTLTPILVSCTPSLRWKICMALRSERLTENSASDLTGNTGNTSTCSHLFMYGSKWLQNWKPEKSARKNMITGDITIRNWIPPRFGQRFRLRNSLTNSSRHWKKRINKELQKEKTLLTALPNFGNSSSVRFLCYRNIFLFKEYCKKCCQSVAKK